MEKGSKKKKVLSQPVQTAKERNLTNSTASCRGSEMVENAHSYNFHYSREKRENNEGEGRYSLRKIEIFGFIPVWVDFLFSFSFFFVIVCLFVCLFN